MVDWFATLHRLSSVSVRFDGECEQNVADRAARMAAVLADQRFLLFSCLNIPTPSPLSLSLSFSAFFEQVSSIRYGRLGRSIVKPEVARLFDFCDEFAALCYVPRCVTRRFHIVCFCLAGSKREKSEITWIMRRTESPIFTLKKTARAPASS
jgi:hypothetical protein